MKTRSTLRRLLLPLAIVLALAGFVQVIRQFTPRAGATAEAMRTLEAVFPQNSPVPVEVELTSNSSELLTPRDLRDQVRDWLLLTALTSSGLDPERLNEVTFDLPPVRYSFMRPVAEWEYGPVRSRAVGGGTVVGLIPANAGVERAGYLCDIADQNRKNLGQIPERLIVLEYRIDPDLASATLTRRETLTGAQLFSSEMGYVEQPLKTLAEFRSFQAKIDDLTYAAVRGGSVVLGGRRIPGRKIKGISTEDIAALWQAEDKLTASSAEYQKILEQKQNELKARWEHRTYRSGDYAAQARLTRELEADQARVAEELQEYRKQHGVADSLGFSLDPTYDFENMAAFVERTLPRLAVDPSKRNRTADSLYPRLFDLAGSQESASTLPDSEVAAVAEGLRKGSTVKFFEALQKLAGKTGEQFYEICEQNFGLQAARYDGDLQYTEPGMILFYTDLLAKLWALDYQHSAPESQIDDFVPLTRVKLSPVYKTELEQLTQTRLWFGPQSKGFQVSSSKDMMLSRNATRLYAASATSLKQGEETAANAQSAAFLGWWDDHFEEVARFEPQYERLNEVMKWSLVLGWLHQNGDLQTLSYLRGVNVPRVHWFPEWAARNPDLRFKNWSAIKFYPKGAFGVKTEALPKLHSEPYEEFDHKGIVISGGVSLASRSTFADRPLLSTRIAEGLRRPNLKYTDSLPNTFKTLEGAEYTFAKNVRRYEVSINPAAESRLRGRVGELANQKIARSLEVRPGGFEYRAQAAQAQIGSLNIGRTANGFKVGWQGRDLEAGYTLGRRLSTKQGIGKSLAADPQVMASTQLGDGTYVARVRGSDRWVRYAEEPQPSMKIEDGWQARVAGYEKNATSVKMQWVDEVWVKEQVGAARYGELAQQAAAKVKPAERLVDSIANRDFEFAARQISRDPLRMYAEIDTIYRQQLAHADQLLKAGKPAEAADYLAGMNRAWGSTPDIAARRAVALADSDQLAAAAHVMERPVAGHARDVNRVYDELARRAAESAGTARAQTWESLRAAGEWQGVAGGRPRLTPIGDRLELDYQLASASGKAQRVTAGEAIGSDAPLYVQDSPQLRNLDWSSNVQQSLRQAVDGDLATVVRLPRTDIAHFRPAKIFAPDETAVARRVDRSSNGSNAARGLRNTYRSSACYDANDPTRAPGQCPEERRSVYVVVPKGAEKQYE